MGFFQEFFSSPKEKAGREGFSNLQNEANNLPNSFEGVNSIDDVYSKYGVKKFDLQGYGDQVKKTFDPARRGLATRQARTLSRAADSLGGRNATPGMTFSGLNSSFSDAFGDLEGRQAEGILGGYDKENASSLNVANLFKGIQESKDAGAMNKLNSKSMMLKNYLDSLSGSSGFEDLTAGLSTAASLATPMGQAGLFGRNAQRAFSKG